MPLLFVIEDVFAIKGRGVIAAGKLADADGARFRIGDPVEVRRRDGSVVRTVISGMEYRDPPSATTGVLFPGVSASDLAIGDEIWTGETIRE
jgi:translation elongation factor EF-Tu-like GTPase